VILIDDDIVKSPSAALRQILRRCGVQVSTPLSAGFACLASGAFSFVVSQSTFYETIIDQFTRKTCAEFAAYTF
jgi:hypothetical protein